MLAELAAANAAFGILKSAVTNGADLAKFGKQIGAIVVGEESLKKKSDREKNSIWSKLKGVDTNELESFMALESIREQKKTLESHFRLYGRPGLWDDYQKYCTQQRVSQRMAEVEREEALYKIKEIGAYILIVVVGLICISGLFYLAWLFRG